MTGGGQPSGSGWLGGYGPIARSSYATPIELGPKPWTADFTHDDNGASLYPTRFVVDPTQQPALEWRTDDWDPGLRFWTLPFDPHLNEWLQDVDLSSPAVMAAREFAGAHGIWAHTAASPAALATKLVGDKWLSETDVAWLGAANPPDPGAGWHFIKAELSALVDQMEGSRARYLDEAWAQADGIPEYFIHFLGIEYERKWWTIMLMRCGLTIGNLVYMHYKAQFRRVRPSVLCPGLVPPFGPPRHPAFPSGHSFLGHFIALLLLEIPQIARRYGVGMNANGTAGKQFDWNAYQGVWDKPQSRDQDKTSPLLWLAWRLGKNREVIGVHYPSDTTASRRLAIAVWREVFGTKKIAVPTLHRVLAHAKAEWV